MFVNCYPLQETCPGNESHATTKLRLAALAIAKRAANTTAARVPSYTGVSPDLHTSSFLPYYHPITTPHPHLKQTPQHHNPSRLPNYPLTYSPHHTKVPMQPSAQRDSAPKATYTTASSLSPYEFAHARISRSGMDELPQQSNR
jgi:hypothetical protein